MVKINTDDNIPSWLIQAARLLEVYFRKKGIEEWELMGVCSREIAFKQRDEIKKLQAEIEALKIEMRDLSIM